MFEEPLTIIRKTTPINPSLENAKLPAAYVKRWGKSVSNIASASTNSQWEPRELTIEAPAAHEVYRIYEGSERILRKDETENIYVEQLGNVVEFLTAYKTVGKQAAEKLYFPQACMHIHDLYAINPKFPKNSPHLSWDQLDDERKDMIVKDLTRLNNLLNIIDNTIDEMKDDCITAACLFVCFHNSVFFGRKRYCADHGAPFDFKTGEANPFNEDYTVMPTIDCCRRIWLFVDQAVRALDKFAPVQSYQFEYPLDLLNSKEIGVNGGRLDFVASNIIFDIKTNKSFNISNTAKMQMLLYLGLIQRVKTNNPVKKATIVDVRTNRAFVWDWDKLTQEERDMINILIDHSEWEYYIPKLHDPKEFAKHSKQEIERHNECVNNLKMKLGIA